MVMARRTDSCTKMPAGFAARRLKWNVRLQGALLVCFFATLTPLSAQDSARERILLPVWSNETVPGAFGSLWKIDLAIVNQNNEAVQIDSYDYGCVLAACPPTPPTPPKITFSPLLKSVRTEVQGFFLYVAKDQAADVHFELRVRDLTRQAQTWGTEIPVVREQDYRTSRFDLVDIPVTNGFRELLRVYDLDPSLGKAQVRVQLFGTLHRLTPFTSSLQPAPQDMLLLDAARDFAYTTSGGGVLTYPGYVELGDLGQYAQGGTFDSVRVEIQPLTAGHRYWAMVSVTNNDSQHVTMITPH